VKPPFPVTVRSSPPLSERTIVEPEASPETCTPTVKLLVEQSTTIPVTFAPATVPVPPVTLHDWFGFVG
jgi:hypothetical protein